MLAALTEELTRRQARRRRRPSRGHALRHPAPVWLVADDYELVHAAARPGMVTDLANLVPYAGQARASACSSTRAATGSGARVDPLVPASARVLALAPAVLRRGAAGTPAQGHPWRRPCPPAQAVLTRPGQADALLQVLPPRRAQPPLAPGSGSSRDHGHERAAWQGPPFRPRLLSGPRHVRLDERAAARGRRRGTRAPSGGRPRAPPARAGCWLSIVTFDAEAHVQVPLAPAAELPRPPRIVGHPGRHRLRGRLHPPAPPDRPRPRRVAPCRPAPGAARRVPAHRRPGDARVLAAGARRPHRSRLAGRSGRRRLRLRGRRRALPSGASARAGAYLAAPGPGGRAAAPAGPDRHLRLRALA